MRTSFEVQERWWRDTEWTTVASRSKLHEAMEKFEDLKVRHSGPLASGSVRFQIVEVRVHVRTPRIKRAKK